MPDFISWLVASFDVFMQLARLLLDYLKVLAWPVVVLTLVLVYKRPIISVLARLRKATGPGYALELDARELVEAAEDADADARTSEPALPDIVGEDAGTAPHEEPPPATTNTPPTPQPAPTPAAAEVDSYKPNARWHFTSDYSPGWLAVDAPAAGISKILFAWNEVERRTAEIADMLSLPVNARSTRQVAKHLAARGYLTTANAEIASRLQNLRDRVVHGREEVTDETVEAFMSASAIILKQLQRARRRILLTTKITNTDSSTEQDQQPPTP